MQKIYIETSVVSYFVAEHAENIIIAGRQISTKKLWVELYKYQIFISDTVVEEASNGNSEQVKLRLEAIKNFHLLEINDKVKELAKLLLKKTIPKKCPEDAIHIAVAAVNQIDFIITWNFKHINNPFIKNNIRHIVESLDYICPEICSPEELLGE